MNLLRILKHTIRSAFKRLNSSDSRHSADKRFPSTLKFSKRVWGQRLHLNLIISKVGGDASHGRLHL